MDRNEIIVIDNEIADLSGELYKLQDRQVSILNDLHYIAGDKKVKRGRSYGWSQAHDVVIDRVSEILAHDDIPLSYSRSQVEGAATSYNDNLGEQARIRGEIARLDQIWRDNGCWSRFFIVKNNNGHIHSSLNCSTCHITTRFGWLPELSGLTEEDAVKAHGAILCTVCFPSAPVEWTNHYEQQEAAKAASECPGSKTWDYDRSTARTGYVSGNAGTCNQCGQRITLTSSGKLRSHKKA